MGRSDPDDIDPVELLELARDDKRSLVHAILMAYQQRTWTECRAELMKALEQTHDGDPEPIPEDEDVYGWLQEVVEAHRQQRGRDVVEAKP